LLPTAFEFHWDAGHMIFFGAFYAVIAVVFVSLSYVAVKSLIAVYRNINAPEGQSGEIESENEAKKPPQEATAGA